MHSELSLVHFILHNFIRQLFETDMILLQNQESIATNQLFKEFMATLNGKQVLHRGIPRTMTEVVPSPTSSSCVRLSSIMDCHVYMKATVRKPKDLRATYPHVRARMHTHRGRNERETAEGYKNYAKHRCCVRNTRVDNQKYNTRHNQMNQQEPPWSQISSNRYMIPSQPDEQGLTLWGWHSHHWSLQFLPTKTIITNKIKMVRQN